MRKILVLMFIVVIALTSTLSVKAKQADKIIKNRLFSIYLPDELNKISSYKTKKDCILFFHNESKKAGFGGFAFGIKAYKNPADHAQMPGGTKIGELTDKKGVLYDMVLIQPTDVQYDYTKFSKAQESYSKLYNLAYNVDISGVNGSKYYKNQGMKGEKLYGDILKIYKKAITEKWDSAKLENEGMSYMYNVIASSGSNTLDKIGYTYYDLNGDGIDELLIGEIADGDWKGVIYDIYTMVNREPKHVVSGGSRNRYFACNSTFICNEYSSGALESGIRVYTLVENSTELFPQVGLKYDGYSNPKNPWFITYGTGINQNDWDNVSEIAFKNRKKTFDKYIRFNYTPFSKL